MNYEEFKDHVVDVIRDYLPSEYMDADISINQVVKNNETLDGLVITLPGQNVSPTLYLNSFYDNYCEGRDMEDILEEIADLRVSHNDPGLLKDLGLSVEDITDYEKIKDSLVAHVVGIKGNEELLEARPHVIKEDMAIMYKIALNDEMSVPITNALFAGYDVPLEDFHKQAMENISERVTVISMSQTIAEMMGGEPIEIPPDKDMIVVSNESKVNGAISIFDAATMDALSEKYGNFIVLPSSVHESLVVPEAAGLSIEDAREMVREVNETQVEPQDRLTDNVYMYDKNTHEIKLCREYIELFMDMNILVKEDGLKLTMENLTDKEMAVYGDTTSDTLGLHRGDPVIVLSPNEKISWDLNDQGFTKSIVESIRYDIQEGMMKSSPLDDGPEKKIKMETPAVALA